MGIYKVTQEIKMMNGEVVERQVTVLAVPAWIIVVAVLGLLTLIVNVVLIIVRHKGNKGHGFQRSKKDDMKL